MPLFRDAAPPQADLFWPLGQGNHFRRNLDFGRDFDLIFARDLDFVFGLSFFFSSGLTFTLLAFDGDPLVQFAGRFVVGVLRNELTGKGMRQKHLHGRYEFGIFA